MTIKCLQLSCAWKGISGFESTHPSSIISNVKSAFDCSGGRFGIKKRKAVMIMILGSVVIFTSRNRQHKVVLHPLGKKWESDVCCCWCQSSRGATNSARQYVQQLRISLSAAAAHLGSCLGSRRRNRIFLTHHPRIGGFANSLERSKCWSYIIGSSASLSRSQWSAVSLSIQTFLWDADCQTPAFAKSRPSRDSTIWIVTFVPLLMWQLWIKV